MQWLNIGFCYRLARSSQASCTLRTAVVVVLFVISWLAHALVEFWLMKPHLSPHGSYQISKRPGITCPCWTPTCLSLGSLCLCYHGNTSAQLSHWTFRNLGVSSWRRLGNKVLTGALIKTSSSPRPTHLLTSSYILPHPHPHLSLILPLSFWSCLLELYHRRQSLLQSLAGDEAEDCGCFASPSAFLTCFLSRTWAERKGGIH